MAWHAAKEAAVYSASKDDNATVACFFDTQDIAPEPRLKMYPLVLFLSSTKPADHCQYNQPIQSEEPICTKSHNCLLPEHSVVYALLRQDDEQKDYA